MAFHSLRLRRSRPWMAPSILAALVAASGLLLPEHPQLQEQICQQHTTAEACRVW
jgi:hypothetical protein